MKKELVTLAKSTERVSVSEIYSSIIVRANAYRDEAKELDLKTYREDAKVINAIADELFVVASALENTEEINPTRITLYTVDGMDLGKTIERDGRKWEVVDNNKVIITTASIV